MLICRESRSDDIRQREDCVIRNLNKTSGRGGGEGLFLIHLRIQDTLFTLMDFHGLSRLDSTPSIPTMC